MLRERSIIGVYGTSLPADAGFVAIVPLEARFWEGARFTKASIPASLQRMDPRLFETIERSAAILGAELCLRYN